MGGKKKKGKKGKKKKVFHDVLHRQDVERDDSGIPMNGETMEEKREEKEEKKKKEQRNSRPTVVNYILQSEHDGDSEGTKGERGGKERGSGKAA